MMAFLILETVAACGAAIVAWRHEWRIGVATGRCGLAGALAHAIKPQRHKALRLRASLELQERNYSAAARTWRTLEALVASGSPDARVIAANIAEAEALVAGTRGKS